MGSKLSHYKKLPRRNIDVGRFGLSKQMKKKANESRQRMKRPFKPYESSDKSYGVVLNETTNEYVLLNYQTTVAMSYQNIDDDISKYYPNLKRNNKQDLRQYVKFLQSQFPKLTDIICENYIKTYELAKFSDHEWTAEMFEEWCTFFREFASSLTLPSDMYSLGDPRVTSQYNPSRLGIQPLENCEDNDYSDSDESDDSMEVKMRHDLDVDFD